MTLIIQKVKYLKKKKSVNKQQIQKVDYSIKESTKKSMPTQYKHHVTKMDGY